MDTTYVRWAGLILLAILFLATAVYGWRSSPSATVNKRFAIQTLVLTWWATGVAGAHSGHAVDVWGRWAFTAACLMPTTFLRFAVAFPTRNYVPPPAVRWGIYVLGALLAGLAASTPWIAHSYRIEESGVLTRTSGPLMEIFVGYYVVAAAVIFVVLSVKWRSARGIPRVQLRLYCVGLLSFCLGGIASNMVSPAIVGDSRYAALGPCFVMVFLAFLSHGIMRHRLMNTRVVIHNWLAFVIATIASIAPLLIITSQLQLLGPGTRGGLRPLALTLLAGLLAPPLWIATRRMIEKHVHRDYARFNTLISDGSRRLSEVLSSAETAAVVADTITSAVRPKGVGIYFRSSVSTAPLVRIHYRRDDPDFEIPEVFPESLSNTLTASNVIASPDYIPFETQIAGEVEISILLKNCWAVVFPLTSEGRLLAVLVVGPKRSYAPYYYEDIRLLNVLTSQATVAFKNGDLYERVLLANEYIQNIVATVQSGIMVVDSQRTVQVLNHAAASLLGIQGECVPVSLPLRDLPAAISALLDLALEDGTHSRATEVLVTQHGSQTQLMFSAAPLRGPGGDIAGVVASLSDLSTLKELEIERARAERLNYFETLAAALAHEIANPLVPIKIMTQLLAKRYEDPHFISEFVRTVGREVSHIETLVQRLNALSAPASRRVSRLDLRSILTLVTDLVQALYDERGVKLVCSSGSAPLMILGEASELQELFLNLLTNAVEATPSGGSVSVDAVTQWNEAAVHIRDTGLGIPSEVAEHIFLPFVSSKNRGSGLGLAICHGIVKRHHGEILARNAEIGAVFTVRLPISLDESSNNDGDHRARLPNPLP